MEKLPVEALTNIFLRIPAKPLAQMRCVSKPWNAFLSKPSFIKSHLDHSIHKKHEILVVFYYDSSHKTTSFTAHPTKSPHLELTDLITPPFNSPSRHLPGKVIGSVNGLICFSDPSDDTIHIWNPSLTASLTLPPSPIDYPRFDLDNFLSESFDVSFGFGFDPETDDYKVVKLTSYLEKGMSEMDMLSTTWILLGVEVQVYSMRKGSWEVLPKNFPTRVKKICGYNEDVCIDGHQGHLHWLCYVDEECLLKTIVAFDLGSYTFSEISLPCSSCKTLGFLTGKLCVISALEGFCKVWVMKEYGVAQSWEVQIVIPRFAIKSLKPLGLTLTGKLVFAPETIEFDPGTSVLGRVALFDPSTTVMGRVALFDPSTKKVKCFETMAISRSLINVVPYVESLVWVTPAKPGRSTSWKGEGHKKLMRQGI